MATARFDPLQARTSSAEALVAIVHDPGPSRGMSATGWDTLRVPTSAPLDTLLLGASAMDLTVELVVAA
ncbi:MAG: hypothetical protein ACYC19_03295 [Acidimicrobiales bacterium]